VEITDGVQYSIFLDVLGLVVARGIIVPVAHGLYRVLQTNHSNSLTGSQWSCSSNRSESDE